MYISVIHAPCSEQSKWCCSVHIVHSLTGCLTHQSLHSSWFILCWRHLIQWYDHAGRLINIWSVGKLAISVNDVVHVYVVICLIDTICSYFNRKYQLRNVSIWTLLLDFMHAYCTVYTYRSVWVQCVDGCLAMAGLREWGTSHLPLISEREWDMVRLRIYYTYRG